MKVTKIETFSYWIEWCNWLFVKVSTDEGLYGWGEGSIAGPIKATETAIHELGQALIGHDPAGVERHWQRMYHAWRWRGGAVGQTALSALDIALWDLEGKRLGVPVYRLLGGPFRERHRVYASHWLGRVKTPEDAYEGAQEAVRRGFRGFKWIPFRSSELRENEAAAIRHGAELMAAAREGAGPDVEIYIECAEFLSPRTAVLAADALKPYHPAWFEEPIPFENIAALASLRERISVPIATGERLLSRFEFRELLERKAVDIIQPDLMHAGGITEVRKISALADTHYVPVAPHNPTGPICNLAALHLSAAIPNFHVLEQMEGERAFRDEISTNPIVYRDGHYELPTAPGLGTDLKLELLGERVARPHRITDSSETLWW